MPADSLRFRQIHLDFHTSELIAGIGSQFDLDEFAETLDAARVNSITCFARGHHGMIFYDTKAHPERKHPHLETNLLAEQIEACHSRDIRVPIYTTVQWDLFTANNHPEWRIITPEGKWEGTPPFEPGFYGGLCVNSPYRDFLKAHVQDIADSVAVDGLFFDIVGVRECVCKY
ncbi:MAG: beta-galactosidase, partial [Candidatus Latescibacteria bacterium]|nr:beta-galactosidase [Candidatus Latescibacterota bacterium]